MIKAHGFSYEDMFNDFDQIGINIHVKIDASIDAFCQLFPANLPIYLERDKNGDTILHYAVRCVAGLQKILACYPTDEARFAAVQKKDRRGRTVLDVAAGHPESLAIILACYPTDEARVAAVQEKDSGGETVLHVAAGRPESILIILQLYPEAERFAALQLNCSGVSVLDRLANRCAARFYAKSNILMTVLDLLPTDDIDKLPQSILTIPAVDVYLKQRQAVSQQQLRIDIMKLRDREDPSGCLPKSKN